MKREQKTILIASLFVFFTVISVSNFQLQTSNSLTTVADDWENYQPIADQDSNWSYLKMVLDTDENLNLFWNARNKIENYTQIYHEIQYTNGSIKRNLVLEEENQTYQIEFDVDIDTLNRVHLVYYNKTANLIVYQIYSNNNWYVIDEFDVGFHDFLIAIDSFDIVHLIVAKFDGIIYDRTYEADDFTIEKQMTFYSLDEDEYITYFKFKKAKSKEGKIALIYKYNLKSELPGNLDREELHCLIYDVYWLEYKKITEDPNYIYDLVFDDTEKLHVIWGKFELEDGINYQTVKGSKWSKINEIILFDQSAEVQYVVSDVSIEVQGKTRMIAYTSSKWLGIGFDIDLYITKSNDGKSWSNQPVYTDNNTRSFSPEILSTTNGDVYITALEQQWNPSIINTYYSVKYEEFFTYETTKVSIENILQIVPLTLSFFVVCVKARKRKT